MGHSARGTRLSAHTLHSQSLACGVTASIPCAKCGVGSMISTMVILPALPRSSSLAPVKHLSVLLILLAGICGYGQINDCLMYSTSGALRADTALKISS